MLSTLSPSSFAINLPRSLTFIEEVQTSVQTIYQHGQTSLLLLNFYFIFFWTVWYQKYPILPDARYSILSNILSWKLRFLSSRLKQIRVQCISSNDWILSLKSEMPHWQHQFALFLHVTSKWRVECRIRQASCLLSPEYGVGVCQSPQLFREPKFCPTCMCSSSKIFLFFWQQKPTTGVFGPPRKKLPLFGSWHTGTTSLICLWPCWPNVSKNPRFVLVRRF